MSNPMYDPLTIYVAGSSAEREDISRLIQVLGEYGYTVTSDWTRDTNWSLPPDEWTDESLIASARADLNAVRAAAVVWYLVPREGKSEGSHGELCAALVLGKEVIVSGTIGPHQIFPRLAESRFHLHAAALEYLRLRAKALL